MTRSGWLLVGGIALVLVVVSAIWLGGGRGGDAVAIGPEPTATTADPTATIDPTATPEPTASPDPTATPTPAPTATTKPTPDPAPTDPPLAHGDPRALYAEFLLRVNDDRATVERLNRALTEAAGSQDVDGVRDAAVEILDFTDAERDWLREHPPAACYAKAHRAARAMVAAYGTTAERALDWAETGGGLAGLSALKAALDAADAAGDALTAFGQTLEATRCP